MTFIRIAEIHIPESRQRKAFDEVALSDLAESLQTTGLLHPIVLRESPEGLTLVAGERRLRAMQQCHLLDLTVLHQGKPIPEGCVPYTNLGQLSELEIEEAELDENIRRVDLSWQERDVTLARIHALRTKQAQAQGRVHTVADTAHELSGRSDGAYQDNLRKSLVVARYMDNPLVAKAKDTNEAFKIIKRQETAQQNVQLARTIGKTFTAQNHKLYNEDCLQWMSAAPAGYFDVICTDPPYGMGADDFGDMGSAARAADTHGYKDDKAHWRKLMTAWAPLSFRITKPEAHAYIFCDIDIWEELKALMQAAGWYVFRTPFISSKGTGGRVPLWDEGPRRSWEMLMYCIKGHKHTTGIYGDVITTSMEGEKYGHAAQKPVALYYDLLRRSVKAGDKVLDTFAGTGTIFPAAQPLLCEVTALELSPEYYAIASKRLAELQTPAQASDGAALMSELFSLGK